MDKKEIKLGAYALFVDKNKLQVVQNVGTDTQGNAITATRTFNLVEDDFDEDTLEDMITFADAVGTITDHTITSVYQSITKRVEQSVGGDK